MGNGEPPGLKGSSPDFRFTFILDSLTMFFTANNYYQTLLLSYSILGAKSGI